MKNLKPFHTFGIPSQAKNIVEFQQVEQLQQQWNTNQPALIIGGGSNMLFVEDFQGTVFINQTKGIEVTETETDFHLRVTSGENWHQFVQWTLENQMFGLENLALIPGTVGAAPVQNIGAYGVEVKDFCEYVEVLNLNTQEIFRLDNAQCDFGYRQSIFKSQMKDGFFITHVGFKLAKNWQPVLKYGSLKEMDPKKVTAKQVFDEVCTVRQTKLPNPKELGNAGSFFMNPVVPKSLFEQLQKDYPTIPGFPTEQPDFIKLAAGWLIDQAGLKGFQLGGAAVHQHQALVLVNKGEATAQDVVNLAHHVCQKVYEKFQVQISPEVRFVGKQGEVNSKDWVS